MRTVAAACLFVLLMSLNCPAQTAPFFSGSATAFEPQVSTAFGGSLLDASATVSQDRKYVTIAAQPTVLGSPALHAFSFVSGPGFVGMSTLADSGTPAQATVMPPSVLDRPGMTFVSPLAP